MNNIINKIKLSKIYCILILWIIIFIYFYFFSLPVQDEVWNYGFCYNIANGLIPYKDFNMIILPFYPILNALIMSIFGHNLIVYHLFNSFLISLILMITCKNSVNIFVTTFFLFFVPIAYGYNIYSSFILILILYLENSSYKYKNEVIGLLIGSVLMTKINLGIFMFIPYFIYSKNKTKSFLFTIIIPIVILIYLLFTNSLFDCINYCFLGLLKFAANKNGSFIVIVLEIIICFFIGYKYIKTRNKNYLYLLLYQGIVYPLCEEHHFLCGFLPIAFYILNYSKNYLNTFIKSIGIMGFICLVITTDFDIQVNRLHNHKIEHFFPTEEYIKKNLNNNIFIFSSNAYLLKINMGIKLTRFDLINKGNMGLYPEKLIEEINDLCINNEDCIFLLRPEEFTMKYSQLDERFFDYVLSKYTFTEKVGLYDVYRNVEN